MLGRFIPDFGRIVAMMQFNMYHHYTVDEHLLRSIGVLAEIDGQRVEHEHPLSNRIVRSIQNRRALYVALFLHDIAKGRTEDHSIAGAGIARRLGPRLGLDPAETETAAWLVEHHLLMSTIAQSRDLSDPKTIETFAGVVQTMERLKLLLVLTIADIKAVGPGVWTGWKGELLRTLYYETEVVLTGGHSELARMDRVRRAQDELRAALPDWSDDAFAIYAQRHYPAYWLKVEPGRRVKHARFVSGRAGGRADGRDHGRDRRVPRRHRAHRDVARPPAASRHHHRRLRGGAAATSSTRRSSPPPTAWRSTPSSFRAPSSSTPTSCAGPSASRPRSSGRSRAR